MISCRVHTEISRVQTVSADRLRRNQARESEREWNGRTWTWTFGYQLHSREKPNSDGKVIIPVFPKIKEELLLSFNIIGVIMLKVNMSFYIECFFRYCERLQNDLVNKLGQVILAWMSRYSWNFCQTSEKTEALRANYLLG